MPRPGPRPYECARRAWHSDRHQPIRGSLIQEIFRIVNEIHSSATKKNKEWQEKLPIVVLKAEEIMYSKANSEAEYVNFNTLWERANDAINTIIRREESTETGELLQPCIEAALHLGCTPRRSSRSQRNITPRCYLNPEKPEAISIPLSNSENKIQGNHATNCSLFLPQTSNFFTTNVSDHSKLPFAPDTFSPTINHQSMPKEPHSSTTTPSFSVYPLYYGNNNNNEFQFQQEDSNFKPSCKSSSHLMIKTEKKVVMEKHSTCGQDDSNVTSQESPLYFSESPHGNGCDLSLRLAPLSVPSLLGGGENQNSCPQLVKKDGGSLGTTTCEVGGKCDDMFSQSDKDFSFFSKPNDHDMLDFCSSAKWSYMTQNLNVEATLGKRKVAVSHVSAEDRQFCWPLKVPFKQFSGRINDSDQ